MQPTMEILARISKNSNVNNGEVFTRLYRYLLRHDLYYIAYKNLYANSGAATKGVDNDTADGFSEMRISKIIKSLKNDTYRPKAVRRTYIEKANGKKRPLGIPTFTDKLVQEVLRMVLEAVYEPVFLDCSHGFRPNRSCHTALLSLRREFCGARWFIEGDIKGCFDNIDHAVLVGLIGRKVKDARIISLIYRFLKAGYMENWQYHNTYSGTPQGGIISPLLANIYLHELDLFVTSLKTEFDSPPQRKYTPEYQSLRNRLGVIKNRIKKTIGTERQQWVEEHKRTRAELLKTPSKSQTDKKIKYIRYADDFLIGVSGNHEDCQWVKQMLTEFIGSTLKMELSNEKTLITHSNHYARFLGYDVRVRRNSDIQPKGEGHCTKRALSNMIELNTPFKEKIHKFVFSKGIAKIKNGSLFPVHRPYLINLTDLEIITIYNAELRGLCNYYGIASNFNGLNFLAYLMEYSCLKTLAAKHKSTIGKIKELFKDGIGGWGIPYDSKLGAKRMYFAEYSECRRAKNPTDIITNAVMVYGCSVTTFESRLKAKVCELCGSTTSDRYEIHHINKVKNLKGRNHWERAMIAKRRKTLAVCQECHTKIHNQ
jgi:group II intron reverse transcriptase/maturase